MDWHWQQEEILPFPYHPVDGEREREKEREGEKERGVFEVFDMEIKKSKAVG